MAWRPLLDGGGESQDSPAPTPKPTKVEYKKLSDRSWAKLVKAPDDYIGRTYQVWACVTQFDAATGPDTFRGEASNKKREYWFLDGENALFTGDVRQLDDIVQDDVVVMPAEDGRQLGSSLCRRPVRVALGKVVS